MIDTRQRMIEFETSPTLFQIESWIGKDAYEYWERVTQLIDHKYPNVFSPDWIFGGKKYGWALRYKKGKSFCTFIPEKNSFAIQIVFGSGERAKAETGLHELSNETQHASERARTDHDGKWLLLTVDSPNVVDDVDVLLAVKRKSVHHRKNS